MPKRSKLGLDVEVTDNGTLKQTGNKAKKAAGSFDVLSQSSRQADRAGKGLARTSSNSTKNFSKMAQGISGGLVPAYAVLAANIFALSAAFRFLQDAMDTANMIAGQQAFGAITGIAYQSITRRIQEATEGMLQFKNAAEAAAIGTAAGLSAKALVALGRAAKNVSLALGRDLADSFDRLIRGVTKAEPELLDELGIVLRLENATRKYAISIGKTRESLTAFERTQAVLNDVLEQAENKFGRVAEIMDPDAFALGRLSKEIDDLFVSFKVVVAKTLIPVFNYLRNNVMMLVAVLSVVLFPILKAIGPNFAGIVSGFRKSGNDLQVTMMTLKAQTLNYDDAIKKSGQSLKQWTFQQQKASATGIIGTLKEKGLPQEQYPAGFKYKTDKKGIMTLNKKMTQQMTGDEIKLWRSAAEKRISIFGDMSDEQLRIFHQNLRIQEFSWKITMKKIELAHANTFVTRMGRHFQLMYLKFKGVMFKMLIGMEAFAAKMMKVFKWLQMLMIAFVIFNILKQLAVAAYEGIRGIDMLGGVAYRALKRAREETVEFTSTLEDLNKELRGMTKVRGLGLLSTIDGLVQLGNALSSADIVGTIQAYNNELAKGVGMTKIRRKPARARKREMLEFARTMEDLSSRFDGMVKAVKSGGRITTGASEDWFEHANAIRAAGQAMGEFEQNQKSVNAAIDKMIKGFAKRPFQDVIRDFNVFINAMETAIEGPSAMKGGKKVFLGGGLKDSMAELEKDYEKMIKTRKELEANIGQFGAKLDPRRRREHKKYGGEEGYLAYQKDVTDSVKRGRIELRGQNDELKIARAYRKDLLTIQRKSELKLADELAGQLKLANVGPGSSAYHKNAKDAYKVVQQIGKQAQAQIDIETAIANSKAVQSRLNNIIKNAEEKMSDLQVAKLFDEDVEYKNAIFAIANARTKLEIQKQITRNVKEETDFQKIINLNQAARLELEREISRLTRQRSLDTAIEARALASAGSIAEVRRLKQGRITSSQNERAELEKKLGRNIIGRDAGSIGAQLGAIAGTASSKPGWNETTGRYDVATQTDAQMAYNTLLDDAEKTQNAIFLLKQKEGTLQDALNMGPFMGALKIEHEKSMMEQFRVYSLNPAEVLAQDQILKLRQEQGFILPEQVAQIRKMSEAQAQLNIEVNLMKGMQDAMTDGFVSMFQAMVDGTESFKDGMKKLFADFMQKMADMMVEAVALRIMMGFTGGLFGYNTGAPTGRSGGVFKSPGYKSFAGGGIAKGPSSGYAATLHGSEAVVPLGNDMAIPVKFETGGPNVSNITINVAAGGQQQTTTANAGERERKLGQLIAQAVQGEILDQQRPGGILSPYGDGSI